MDLALLRVDGLEFHRHCLAEGFQPYAVAFHVETLDTERPPIRVAQLLPSPSDSFYGFTNGPSAGGFSGGPVLAAQARVVGMFGGTYGGEDQEGLMGKYYIKTQNIGGFLQQETMGMRKYYSGIFIDGEATAPTTTALLIVAAPPPSPNGSGGRNQHGAGASAAFNLTSAPLQRPRLQHQVIEEFGNQNSPSPFAIWNNCHTEWHIESISPSTSRSRKDGYQASLFTPTDAPLQPPHRQHQVVDEFDNGGSPGSY